MEEEQEETVAAENEDDVVHGKGLTWVHSLLRVMLTTHAIGSNANLRYTFWNFLMQRWWLLT